MDSECNVVLAPAGVQRMKRKMERFTEMKVGLPSRYFYQELKRGFDNSGSTPQIIPPSNPIQAHLHRVGPVTKILA